MLSNNLSQINNAVPSNHSNQQESLADQPGIDEEINYPIAASNSSQPTSINLDSSGLRRSTTMTSQNTHLRSASQRSFSSARVPSFTICSNLSTGLSSSVVHSLAVKVPVTSTNQSGPLAEQPTAATDSSNNILSATLDSRSARPTNLSAVLDLRSTSCSKSNSAILIDLPTSQRKAMIHFYNGSSQNESSCASQLAARAKSQSEVQRHVKFIVELVLEISETM